MFDLAAGRGRIEFHRGVPTGTYGINGAYLGPTLRADRGERGARQRAQRTGEHDHRALARHAPAAAMDGGPHQPIAPGATWSPDLADRPAGRHALVSPAPARRDRRARLPRAGRDVHPRRPGHRRARVAARVRRRRHAGDRAGQDVRRDGQLDLGAAPLGDGHPRGAILVNGTLGPVPRGDAPSGSGCGCSTPPTRGSTISASPTTARSRWSAPTAGLLARPYGTRPDPLSPGERAEIVVTLRPGSGRCCAARRRRSARRFETDSTAARTTVRHPAAARRAAPARRRRRCRPRWPRSPRLDPRDAVEHAEFGLRGAEHQWPHDGHGPDRRNGRRAAPWRSGGSPTPTARRTASTCTTCSSRSLGLDGGPPPPQLAGWKDTVYVPPDRQFGLVMPFADYADPHTPYMFHCHVLRHEDQGMMGQFIVVEDRSHARPSAHRR